MILIRLLYSNAHTLSKVQTQSGGNTELSAMFASFAEQHCSRCLKGVKSALTQCTSETSELLVPGRTFVKIALFV